VVIKKVQGTTNPAMSARLHSFDGDARSVSLLLKATSLTAYFTCQSESHFLSARVFVLVAAGASVLLKNPCFENLESPRNLA
jgi:hypothetical protein